MDGDSRGGAALSVKAVSGKPIKFVGTGEKLESLEVFYPDRIASRILGVLCSHYPISNLSEGKAWSQTPAKAFLYSCPSCAALQYTE